jgi:hypothetical protein
MGLGAVWTGMENIAPTAIRSPDLTVQPVATHIYEQPYIMYTNFSFYRIKGTLIYLESDIGSYEK